MITKDTILLDLVEKHPNTEEYFRSINKDKCILCYNLFDTPGDISKEFELELTSFLKDIESLF